MPGRPATLTAGAKPERTYGGHLGAWLMAGVLVVVAAAAPAPVPDVARYTLAAIALYLLLAGADRWANPINRFARNLGGSL